VQAERDPSIDRAVMDLCAELGSGARPPSLDAPLADLGLDSLACADLAVAVEERFGVRLADGDAEELRTVGDVASAVHRRPEPAPGLPKGIGRAVGAGKAIAGSPIGWWFHMRISGTEHVPTWGPVIIAANHRSMWDIPILVVACPRRLVFMAKIELYKNWLLKRLWFEFGGFPVRRDVADLRAIDMSLAVLDRELALGIYPEGTRSFTGEMLPFLHGAAWLALRTGASIVPCAITGTSRRLRGDEPRSRARRPVMVAFGPPIRVQAEGAALARRSKAEALTGRLLEEMTALMA
jgi:1-acyl-sn-glycerol-3-phosphate acyltransferase